MDIFNDTIAAVATAPGIGGIGIIRLSGPDAATIARGVFRRPQAMTGSDTWVTAPPFRHQRLHYGFIVHPDTNHVVDEVLVAYFAAPHSYTREEIIEIQSHAGSAVLQTILGLVVRSGARLAEAGEFTRRAFLNGRIDLTQAEAIADLIEAKTEQALNLAAHQLTGAMKSRVDAVRDLLEQSAARLEAILEFPDEVEEDHDLQVALQSDTTAALDMIEALIRAHHANHLYHDGIQVSVVGRPNVGKSSLLNALVQKERAIVTALPGTTRDVVTDRFQVSGFPFEIADTAGLRPSQDIVEEIGIQKTQESIAAAHLILFVVDAGDFRHTEEKKIYSQIKNKPHVLVINKEDLAPNPPTPPLWIDPQTPAISVSAKYLRHIEKLKKCMVDQMVADRPTISDERIAPNLRQRLALEKAAEDISNAISAWRSGESEEFIVFNLQRAMNNLGTITGDTHNQDLLDIVFDRFCIGK